MLTVTARNVQQALPKGLRLLREFGEWRNSRNGEVLVAPCPVTTVYTNPTERVLFWDARDANPFFHLAESLWMLAGRNDIEFVSNFAAQMSQYSDDGVTQHGAYGHRWLYHFGLNQLPVIARRLREDPEDRRCVLQMWNVITDLDKSLKDVPCNTHVYFSRNSIGELDMTVCCRSNDIIWGAYGANAVHFSVLQEFMAAAIGCPVGAYWQVSNNFHAYKVVLDQVSTLSGVADNELTLIEADPYSADEGAPEVFPLVSTPVEQWRQDLEMVLNHGGAIGMRDPFLRRVALPMLKAHQAWRSGNGVDRYNAALEIIQQCQAEDWRMAGEQWLIKRRNKFLNKE